MSTGRIPRKAMVLAAGRGTRLRPLTDRLPKCMVPIGGKPLLEHTIEWLRGFGVTEVVINLSHLPDVIRAHLGDGGRWGVRITYSLEAEPLGTAGGVKRAAGFFDGPFFLWYGDNLSTCNLARLYDTHRATGGRATMVLHWRADPAQSGIVALDEDDRIVRFLEKPVPGRVPGPAGVRVPRSHDRPGGLARTVGSSLSQSLRSLTIDGMAVIHAIREKVGAGAFEFSQHATDQSILRHISVQELREAVAVGEVIEDYPNDKYGPSCVILGFTGAGRPIHVQCSYPSRSLVKIITIYEPDSDHWLDYRRRRS